VRRNPISRSASASRRPREHRVHIDRAGRELISAAHHQVTGELLHLLDGFYLNIEDGLFELAYRSTSDDQRRRCFDLMRELRFRRAGLVKHFARAMDRSRDAWFEASAAAPTGFEHELDVLVARMAEKTAAHFGGLLACIAERVEAAGARTFSGADLPISPRNIALAFVQSCRSLKLDADSIGIVQELFSRFVLDGLGSVYGGFNQRLEEAGFRLVDDEELTIEAI